MTEQVEMYDLVVKGGRVLDPATNLDTSLDIAVTGGKIVAVAKDLPEYRAKEFLDVSGGVVTPGFIDLHVHCNEWISPLALNADDLGIHSGVTTVVSMGDTGAYTVRGFKNYIVPKAKTEVVCFPSVMNHGINFATCHAEYFHTNSINVKASIRIAQEEPGLVKGFKVHGDEGCLSQYGTRNHELAREICDGANLPLYMHTGSLMTINKSNAPDPKKVIDAFLPFLRPGDILAHPFAFYHDCMLAGREEVPAPLRAALDSGVLLDLGRGHHFSIDIAKKMLPKGIVPYTLSSDAHGTMDAEWEPVHDDTALTYSLFGTLSMFLALGMPLADIVTRVTLNPARVLRMEKEIGTLAIGSRADFTIFDIKSEKVVFHDALGKSLEGNQKLIPRWVVREGEVIKPQKRLLRDLAIAA